ncbi:glycosyltransferase family 1 protein [uncultured Mucilaginibacter sp.]|uniref:glycosyltransferase family 4 protein n=1 Tax=uncultured Mucilaginibacter sp. TaxID=797541 RepID=UPI002604A4C2|nr:glycosyltransferase family 1 protein [uncultured Mucilaginibacter sp.]
MKKSIFINASMITAKPTGVGIYNIELLKKLLPKLVKENIDFIVYCYHPKLVEKFIDKDKIRILSLGPLLDKILLRFLSVHRILWNLFVLRKAAAGYAIIYALATYGPLNCKKQIITVHDLIALQFPQQHKFQFLYFKFIVPIILYNSAKVIAISDFTAKEITKHFPKIKQEKIEVIKNGVDHILDQSNAVSDDLVDKITHHKPFCLMVGASYYHKNAKTLLKVAKILEPNNIQFVVAGRPSLYYKSLMADAKNQQLKNVFFMDYVDEATLSSFYKKAALHIYISLYEGFGFPPAEAAFYGTKTIISNHPALLEIYADRFPSVEPENAMLVANLIKQNCFPIAKDAQVYHALESMYNWEKTSVKVYELLTNAIIFIQKK